MGKTMTLILAKHCIDGVLLVADGIRVVNRNGTIEYHTGDCKLVSGSRAGKNYAIVFGGHAQIDSLRHTRDWLREAAQKTGPLYENVAIALQQALTDAQSNANWTNQAEKIEWENRDGSCYAFVSDDPGLMFYVEVTVLSGIRIEQVNYGNEVISLPVSDPNRNAALMQRRNDSPMSLKDAARHFGELFEFAVETMPDGCRYPGRFAVLWNNGKSNAGEFTCEEELARVADCS